MKAYILVTAGGRTIADNGEDVDNLQVLAVVQADTALSALNAWKDEDMDMARAFAKSEVLVYELAGVCPVTLPIVSNEEAEAPEFFRVPAEVVVSRYGCVNCVKCGGDDCRVGEQYRPALHFADGVANAPGIPSCKAFQA